TVCLPYRFPITLPIRSSILVHLFRISLSPFFIRFVYGFFIFSVVLFSIFLKGFFMILIVLNSLGISLILVFDVGLSVLLSFTFFTSVILPVLGPSVIMRLFEWLIFTTFRAKFHYLIADTYRVIGFAALDSSVFSAGSSCSYTEPLTIASPAIWSCSPSMSTSMFKIEKLSYPSTAVNGSNFPEVVLRAIGLPSSTYP